MVPQSVGQVGGLSLLCSFTGWITLLIFLFVMALTHQVVAALLPFFVLIKIFGLAPRKILWHLTSIALLCFASAAFNFLLLKKCMLATHTSFSVGEAGPTIFQAATGLV